MQSEYNDKRRDDNPANNIYKKSQISNKFFVINGVK